MENRKKYQYLLSKKKYLNITKFLSMSVLKSIANYHFDIISWGFYLFHFYTFFKLNLNMNVKQEKALC